MESNVHAHAVSKMRAGWTGRREHRGDVVMDGFDTTTGREQRRRDRPHRKNDPLAMAIHHLDGRSTIIGCRMQRGILPIRLRRRYQFTTELL